MSVLLVLFVCSVLTTISEQSWWLVSGHAARWLTGLCGEGKAVAGLLLVVAGLLVRGGRPKYRAWLELGNLDDGENGIQEYYFYRYIARPTLARHGTREG